MSALAADKIATQAEGVTQVNDQMERGHCSGGSGSRLRRCIRLPCTGGQARREAEAGLQNHEEC